MPSREKPGRRSKILNPGDLILRIAMFQKHVIFSDSADSMRDREIDIRNESWWYFGSVATGDSCGGPTWPGRYHNRPMNKCLLPTPKK